jgi:hypothetical protein
MTGLDTFSATTLWTLYMLLKSIFFGGYLAAHWLAWLLSPLWATIAAAGAAWGFFSDR